MADTGRFDDGAALIRTRKYQTSTDRLRAGPFFDVWYF